MNANPLVSFFFVFVVEEEEEAAASRAASRRWRSASSSSSARTRAKMGAGSPSSARGRFAPDSPRILASRISMSGASLGLASAFRRAASSAASVTSVPTKDHPFRAAPMSG